MSVPGHEGQMNAKRWTKVNNGRIDMNQAWFLRSNVHLAILTVYNLFSWTSHRLVCTWIAAVCELKLKTLLILVPSTLRHSWCLLWESCLTMYDQRHFSLLDQIGQTNKWPNPLCKRQGYICCPCVFKVWDRTEHELDVLDIPRIHIWACCMFWYFIISPVNFWLNFKDISIEKGRF